MPLNAIDWKGMMGKPLNDPVISILHSSKLMTGFFNTLVVGAVDWKTFPIEP